MAKKKEHYLDNKKLYTELTKYITKRKEAEQVGKAKPIINDFIGKSLWDIAEHLSHLPQFQKYKFRDEMVSDAIINCLHRDTKIITMEFGPIEISKIVGESVTVKAADGIWRQAIVKSYGKQKLYEYSFSSFNTALKYVRHKVIATENHRWFVDARVNSKKGFDWVNGVIDDLRVGDMLSVSPYLDGRDINGIIHGLVFGDGRGQKSIQTKTTYGDIVTTFREEIVGIMRNAGYTGNYPPSAEGDPVFHIGKFPVCKDVPSTLDPSYISGFIYGWWLVDGYKTVNIPGRIQISSTNEAAISWLIDHAAYGGYIVTGVRKKERHGIYKNGKPPYVVTLSDKPENYKPRVREKIEFGEDEVFCVVEPVTNGFVLANGLLTGNCLQYIDNFDPEKSSNPLAYFTQISWYAFLRRIEKEKKYLYTKYKSIENTEIFHGTSESAPGDKTANELVKYSEGARDNMNDFVSKFETSLENKKKKLRDKKKENQAAQEANGHETSKHTE